MLTPGDRWMRFLHYQSVDRPPFLLPGGPWGTTLKRWHAEGLPRGVSLEEHFGTDPHRCRHVGIETQFYPAFTERIIEETPDFVIKIDSHGVKVRNFHDESSMAEHLEYPIKSRADLAWLKERLSWTTPGRVRVEWQDEARARRAAGGLSLCNGGTYFAFLNEHMGTDRLMFAYVDDPDFVHEVNELLCILCEQALRTCVPTGLVDYIGYHEDMAYKNGSLISPAMFREFMTPCYQRIRALTVPAGLDLHMMDSDGDIRQLIPLWLEVGINSFTPCEVAAGMDVVALRREYGQAITMLGGFDKRILASDRAAIKAEVERLRPVIEGGGYLCSCDHGVPHDVSFANYSYLVECLRTICGVR